jgi:uncharacterized protein YcfL
MGFNRILQWLLPVLMSLFLVTGCGDLEPEMQDTRTVILNMDFHGKSSSRSSSSVSASELSQYNTHLILALPSREYLTSSYKNYYSSFAQGLMNTADKKVSLEIPLNTQMKIFAFLFKENYSMSELFSGVREVGYYGESQSFSISTNTNSLSLGITLQSTGTDTNTGGGSTDTTPPVISGSTITTPTNDNTPDFMISSSEAGTITYGGSCSSSTTSAIAGSITVTFNTLSDGIYDDCTFRVTDSAGNVSNTWLITAFMVQTISTLPAPDNLSASGANNTITLTWNSVSGATSYTLYWDNVSGIDNSDTPINSITNDNYTHSNMDNGSIYYYKVAAVNSSGTGTLSSVASALLSSYVKDSASLSGHTFAITSAAMNWNNAKVQATALGGYLTTVNSKAENDWLTTRFRIQHGAELWIGANDIATNNTWVWDNGTTSGDSGLTDNLSNNAKWADNITRKWVSGEPNHSGASCGQIWKTSGPNWDDTPCNNNKYAIIEFD